MLPGNAAGSTTNATFTSRNWSQFDVDAFESELATSQLAVSDPHCRLAVR